MPIPAILAGLPILLIVAAIIVIVLSLLSAIWPALGLGIWALLGGLLAYFTKDVTIYKSKNTTVSLGVVFGTFALIFAVMAVFNINPPDLIGTSFGSFTAPGAPVQNVDATSFLFLVAVSAAAYVVSFIAIAFLFPARGRRFP